MKKVETLAEYTRRVMLAGGLNSFQVEARAKAEALKRGLEETHNISDATINNILTDRSGNQRIFTLIALAWGLSRPVEEVVNVAFGLGAITQDRQFTESVFARLAEIYRDLPADERKFFNRQIESLERDLHLAKNSKKKSD